MRTVTWNVFIVPDLADRHVACQQTMATLLPEFFHRYIHELRHLEFLKAQMARILESTNGSAFCMTSQAPNLIEIWLYA